MMSFTSHLFASNPHQSQNSNELRIQNVKRLLGETKLVIRSNCFADEIKQPDPAEYDNTSEVEHYEKFGNERDEEEN